MKTYSQCLLGRSLQDDVDHFSLHLNGSCFVLNVVGLPLWATLDDASGSAKYDCNLAGFCNVQCPTDGFSRRAGGGSVRTSFYRAFVLMQMSGLHPRGRERGCHKNH